jgi:hypothetical protein
LKKRKLRSAKRPITATPFSKNKTAMNIIEIISVKQNGRFWDSQPEWECIVKLDNGETRVWKRCAQWSAPQLHQLQAEALENPHLFETFAHQPQ